jgi:hypothetical protein
MSYVIVEDVAASWEQYADLAAVLAGPAPAGLIVHAAGPTDEGFRVVALWESEEALAGSRTPAIMADAAYAVLRRDPRNCTGNFFVDEEVLAQEGLTDLEGYRTVPGGGRLEADLFLEPLESDA